MTMKYFLGGSAVLATAFLTASFAFYVPTSITVKGRLDNDNKQKQIQDKKQEQTNNQTTQNNNQNKDNVAAITETKEKKDAENKTETKDEVKKEENKSVESNSNSLTNAERYTATAYSLRGRTATGRGVARGIIAADPRVLPLGSIVRIEAGNWSGEYLVADTGGKIKGKKIDIWVPSTREAMRFGRRTVKLTVLTYGAKRAKAKRTATKANKAQSNTEKTEKKK
jgi:3D (Asp-Asp-Asp) domain-containing protein